VLGAYAYQLLDAGHAQGHSPTRHPTSASASEPYRAAARRSSVPTTHIQIGLIAQGSCSARIQHPRLVWSSFGSWLRTDRPGIASLRIVTAAALRCAIRAGFLSSKPTAHRSSKFMRERIEPANCPPLRLAG